jgi:hypothetical protein
MSAITGRIAVFNSPGRCLELREVAVPPPQADELLVEVTCCTLCGSDLHTYQGRRPAPRRPFAPASTCVASAPASSWSAACFRQGPSSLTHNNWSADC